MRLPRQGSDSLYSNSFFIFIIRFFPSLANLLVMIAYSRHFPPSVYGQYQNVWIRLFVISPVICFGIHVLLMTYSRQKIEAMVQVMRPVHYLLYGAWAVAAAAVFAGLNFHILEGALVPFVLVLAYALTQILEAYLIICRRYGFISTFSLVFSATWCAVHWWFMKDTLSLTELFLYLTGLVSVRLVAYLVISIREYRHNATHTSEVNIDLAGTRSLWLHLGLYDVIQILFSYVDKFVIALLLAAPVSAVYYNGSQNIPFLPLLLGAAGSAVLMQLAAGKDRQGGFPAIGLMLQSGRALSCIVFPVFFYLFFFRSEVILWLFHEQYVAAIPVFMVSILVLPVRAYNFTTVLQHYHKGYIINAGAIADLLLACALMYPLYHWLGLPGVALSFVITTYLQAGFYLYYAARLLHTSPVRLIPLADWGVKFVLFGLFFWWLHYCCAGYFPRLFTVILGGLGVIVAVVTSLWMEMKKQQQNGGTK
jgi:O-antigen/teichoic acid export membrane protein